MRQVLRHWVADLWYPYPTKKQGRSFKQMVFFLILFPFSLLYGLISLFIQYGTALKQGLGFGYKAPVPVVVVGNFTVGGTGKTPLVIHLCQELIQQGFEPGIVSRGYGRKTNGVLVVTEDMSSQMVGDEASLVFKLTKRPMVVGNKRNKAIQRLLSIFPKVNVIISDDGLQHAGLQADVSIVVIDGERKFGNGWCLPAGPLRAPRNLGSFSRITMAVINERGKNQSLIPLDLSPQYHMRFKEVGFIKINPGMTYDAEQTLLPVADFIKAYHGKHFHAVAGIGNPDGFFDLLKKLGLPFTPHVYPDHHDFKAEDLTFQTTDPIIMTEKDAVKCADLLWHGDCWALKIRVTIEESFLGKVVELVKKTQSNGRSNYDR
jgi:tetraacyldisaccharide 4'-kinase